MTEVPENKPNPACTLQPSAYSMFANVSLARARPMTECRPRGKEVGIHHSPWGQNKSHDQIQHSSVGRNTPMERVDWRKYLLNRNQFTADTERGFSFCNSASSWRVNCQPSLLQHPDLCGQCSFSCLEGSLASSPPERNSLILLYVHRTLNDSSQV